MKFKYILFFLTLVGCLTDNDQSSTAHRELIENTLKPTLDSIFYFPGGKKIGVYWQGRILDGHYRRKFVDIMSDSFRIKNKIDEDDFKKLIKSIQDTLIISFKNHEQISGLKFLKELPDKDSINNYFIVKASASSPILDNDSGLIYIETMDLFDHNGDGVICELVLEDKKWTIHRIVTAWWMRMDTVRMGVFH